MTQATPFFAKNNSSPAGIVFAASCAVGLTLGLLTLLLLLAFAAFEEKRIYREAHLNGLRMIVANMDNLWDTTALFAEKAAADIQSAGPQRLADKLEQQRASWPRVILSLYDHNGTHIPLDGDHAFRPSDGSVRALVHQALVGQNAKDVTRNGPYTGLSAATPVRIGKARALVASVTLDEAALADLKRHSAANLAVLSVDDSGNARKDELATAANTYGPAGGEAARTWESISKNPPLFTSKQPGTAELPGGGLVAAALMENALGLPISLLIASAENPAAYITWPQILTAAALAAILSSCLSLFFLRRYTRRMGESFAGAALGLAERNARSEGKAPYEWPLPLQDALAAVSRVLQEYKKRTRAAEAERDAAWRLRRENASCGEAGEEEDYLRLFDNTPVGVFQAENTGAFRRVNQAFALMLGYDNPALLLAENPSFTDLCLYGGEIRNPLNALVEQGGGRQIISLRKRDGKAGEYTVICVPLTSASGDLLPVVEGYLLDRYLEGRLSQAERERERSERQRTSLALLLASTSLQTGNVLSLPQSPPSPRKEQSRPEEPPAQAPVQTDPACPAKGTERRKSVRSVLAVMSDIFNIAMAEATGSAPVDLPIELDSFLRQLCRQAAPQLQARGISLHCEAASDLPTRFSGRAPILRHALQRALFAVSMPAKGGWAYLGVRRDPNHPSSIGLTRLLFSISWSSFRHEEIANRKEEGMHFPLEQTGFIDIYTEEAPEIAERDIPKQKALQLANEQDVIRYLTTQLDGELFEGTVSATQRSMQLIVALTRTGDFSERDAAPPAALVETGTADDAQDAVAENDTLPELGVSPLGDEEVAPLSILVEDLGDFEFTGVQADKNAGLDILLIDDNMNTRMLFSLYLRNTPHRITEARSGQEGVEAFKRGRFDVIFMDMEMPLMDGYQATRIIRALEADSGQKTTPIVGMTAYALPEFRHQCILSGCTDFLSKPFGKIALYSVLDAFSQLKKGEPAPEQA